MVRRKQPVDMRRSWQAHLPAHRRWRCLRGQLWKRKAVEKTWRVISQSCAHNQRDSRLPIFSMRLFCSKLLQNRFWSGIWPKIPLSPQSIEKFWKNVESRSKMPGCGLRLRPTVSLWGFIWQWGVHFLSSSVRKDRMPESSANWRMICGQPFPT